MKKVLSVLLCILLFCAGVFPSAHVYAARGTTYYVDGIDGSDETGDGLSPETAWKTVPVTECTLSAGDAVLFRRGGVYPCTLTGTDAPYKTEGFFAKLARFFRTLFHVVQNLITEGW